MKKGDARLHQSGWNVSVPENIGTYAHKVGTLHSGGARGRNVIGRAKPLSRKRARIQNENDNPQSRMVNHECTHRACTGMKNCEE